MSLCTWAGSFDEDYSNSVRVGNKSQGWKEGFISNYGTSTSHAGIFTWNELRMGNNGINEIVAGAQAANGYFSFYVNNTSNYNAAINGTKAMVIDANGNVIVAGGGSTAGTAYNHASGRGNLAIEGTSQVHFALGVGGTRKGYLYHDGTNMTVSQAANGYLLFNTNETNRMIIDSSGNVGIGTNAPDSLLHLKNASDYAPELKIEHTGGHNNGGLLMRSTGTAANGDRLGHIQFDGLNSASENIRYAEIGGFIDDVADSSEDGKITFSTYVAGTHAERMTIKGGNVGIGDTTPSYKLEVAGTFYASGSSIEYKEDVEPYTPPEGALMGLKPVQYQYKDAWKDFGKRYSGNSSRQIGFVAEDVAKILPELAVTKSEDGKEVVRNVDYEKLTVLLVSEVQSLRKEVNDLRTSR
jgi:hypothetical protein